MTTNIDRAAEVVASELYKDPVVNRELFGDEHVAIAHDLADAGLLAPDLPEFDDQDLVGVDDYGHIFVRHEVDDQWLAVEEAHDLAFALLAAANQAEEDMADTTQEEETNE